MPALGLELRWRALRLHDDDLRRVPLPSGATIPFCGASVPVRDLLDDLRIMRRGHLLLQRGHQGVRVALGDRRDLL